MSTVIFCIFLTFPARFNHKFDEVQAGRQEIAQILDQKLSKQGLSSVSKICLSVQVFDIANEIEDCFYIGRRTDFKNMCLFLIKGKSKTVVTENGSQDGGTENRETSKE